MPIDFLILNSLAKPLEQIAGHVMGVLSFSPGLRGSFPAPRPDPPGTQRLRYRGAGPGGSV